MSKKNVAAAANNDISDTVSPQELKEIFWNLYGNEKEYEELMQEHYEMSNYHHIKAELDKEVVAERRRKRQAFCEARRLEEEARRIKEMRDNPENLNQCAAKIQKFVRRNIAKAEYLRARDALSEKPQKTALIIITNYFEDRRVRVDHQAVHDSFELARTLLCLGFRVELLCDVQPYDDFLATYDEPLAATDSSGRYFSAAQQASSPSSSPAPGGSPQPTTSATTTLGTSSLMRLVKPPTRQNIVNALAEISKSPSDTLVWVHVCSVGGRASVNGKNPSRLAADAMVRTPRTRLLNALHAASAAAAQRSTNGGGANATTASDTCHFMFPSDGRSARITFDNILRVDEVLDVLSPRHSPQVYGHPLHQRIVTMEISPIGCVEGSQGGGFACIGSTSTATRFWETPAKETVPSWIALTPQEGPTRGCALGDPQTSLLTYALQQCLLGHCWSRINSTPRLYCSHMVSYLDRWMTAHGCTGDVRGLKGWGDFPILEGDKLSGPSAFLERIYGLSTTTSSSLSPGGGGATTTTASSAAAAGSAATASKQRRHRPVVNSRGVCFEVTTRFDITEDRNGVSGLDVFDPEFTTILQHTMMFFGQHDLIGQQQYRQLRGPILRSAPSRSVLIGINSTFVEVSAKTKLKGTESGVWNELVSDLTGGGGGNSGTLPNFTVTVAKAHEGGGILLTIAVAKADVLDSIIRRVNRISEIIPGITHNALMLEVRCEMFSTVSVMEQLSLRARQIGALPTHQGLVQPLIVEAKKDGGGDENTSANSTPRPDSNLDPPRQPTFATSPHLSYPDDKFETESQSSPVAGRLQRGLNKTLSMRRFSAGGGGGASSPTSSGNLTVNPTRGQILVELDQIMDAITIGMSFSPLVSTSAPSAQLLHVWGECMEYCQQQIGGRGIHRNIRVLKPKLNAIRITSVRTLCMRVNDTDDVALSILAKRDRPPTPLALHAGTAVCVVALYNPTSEARCRQALHVHRVSQTVELIGGIRFLIWDVANDTYGFVNHNDRAAIRAAAATAAATTTTTAAGDATGAPTSPAAVPPPPTSSSSSPAAPTTTTNSLGQRANLIRLLENLKLNIGTNAAAYPALMLWDMTRKRYYRLKAQPQAAAAGGGGGVVGRSTSPDAAAAASSPDGLQRTATFRDAKPPPFVTSLASSPSSYNLAQVATSANLAATSSGITPPITGGRSSVFSPADLEQDKDSFLSSRKESFVGGGHHLNNTHGSNGHSSSPPVYYHATAPCIYSATAIAHFCDEFLRGGLNDLLPPVRGSKVIGGGHSTTKYALMPL